MLQETNCAWCKQFLFVVYEHASDRLLLVVMVYIPYAAPDLWYVMSMAKYYGFAVIISSTTTMYDPYP
jgi:hypothetical protein